MRESPDNLVSKAKYRLIDALCHGPIQGFVSGNDDYGPYKSSFFNDTVLMNADNTFNFNITGDNTFFYALGETGQAVMPGFGHVENFIPLPPNTEIKQLVENPVGINDYKDVVVSINNRTYPDAGSVRITLKVPQLLKQTDPSSANQEGSLEGYQVKYRVEISLNGGAYVSQNPSQDFSIEGKTTTGYSRTVEFPLPSDDSNYLNWKIRIRRASLNISSIKVANSLFVESVSVISKNEYRYPNTVLVGLELDSEKLGGAIPSRIYEIYGLKVKVPSNYNPVTRTYTGIWLGAFKPSTSQGSNIITNPNFTGGSVTGWATFRSNLTTSASSPPASYTDYAVATVDTNASGEKSYFSIYQTPSAPQATTYIVRGYYKLSSADLLLKIGINNVTIDEYASIGRATTWTYFETQITSASYSGADWVEFAAQRAGECLSSDVLYLTGLEVLTPATDGKEYTNNPAWVFYDLCTNKRYGLGNVLKSEWIDKWTLYQIAQYCDEMVDDGDGGQEPRFTCNAVISQQQEAFKVLMNLVSVFRGMLYFSNGRLFPVQDALKTFIAEFTNANVLDGVFNYGSSSKRTRHTVALVKWNDPKNFYKETTEVVTDTDGITKYGYQQLEMTAFACTSQGQAHRAGKWVLVSEALETETVTFKTALEGINLRPGDIFQVQDNLRYDVNFGGRLIRGSTTNVTLDRDVPIAAGNIYDLTVITPRYQLEATGDITGSDQIGAIRNSQITTARISTASYTGADITVATSLGTDIGPGTVWEISLVSGNNSATVRPKQYRCLATSEASPFEIEVLGLEYNTGKFGLIETGFSIINNEVYENTPEAPPIPGGFSDGTYQRLGVNYVVDEQQDYVRDYLELDWFPVESNILKFYRVRVTPPGSAQYVATETLSDTYSFALSGCRPTGQYLFSVTSVGNGLSESSPLTGGYTVTRNDGIGSLTFNTVTPITGVYGWPYDQEWLNSGFETRTPVLTILRNTGDYDGNDPRFFYITGYEFQILSPGTSTVLLNLGNVARESIQLTSANITTIGNIRTFDIKVTPLPCIGSGAAGFSAYVQRMTNKPPLNSVSATFTNAGGGINYNIIPNPEDVDISGVYLWANTSPVFSPNFTNHTLSSDSFAGLHTLSSTGSYYLWHSVIDSYSTTDCTIQGPSSVVHYVGVPANSIADGAINGINKFISSIQPVQVVSSLGSITSPTQGMMAFLSTDLKLYRYMGSTWSAAVSGADIGANSIVANKLVVGTIEGGYIAADAISGVHIRAGQVYAEKIGAGTITSQEIIIAGGTAGILRSDNYSVGSAGWKIDGNGDAYFNNISAHGAFTGGAGSNLNILDGQYFMVGNPANSRMAIAVVPGFTHTRNLGVFNTSNNLVATFGMLTDNGSFGLNNSAGTNTITMYGDGTSTFNGLMTLQGELLIDSSDKLYFYNTSNGTYIKEDYGINLYGDTTHPVRIRSAALVLNDSAATSYTAGRVYDENSDQILRERYAGTPATLGDVIAVLQHHGLCN